MFSIVRLMAPLLIASTLAHGSAALAEPAAIAMPAVDSFTLDNGLQVVVIPDHRAPVVTHMLWYKVGAADEPDGASGIAHFLEHLMFKGTEKHPTGQFSAMVAELGGQENAFTSQDYTAYYQRVAKEHLPVLMEFEADRMAGLILSDEVVTPERDVVLEERRLRVDSDPSSRLSEAVAAALFLNHPYRTPIIGWQHEIEGLDRHAAIAFYERFYTPNNAVLVIAGDVETPEVRKLAEASYGKVERRAEPGERLRPREPEPIAARRVTLADARVRQPQLSRTYLAPSYNTAEGKTAYALDLLAVILGGGSTSRLHRALVVDQGIAAQAGSYYQGDALDQSRFTVYALPRPGVEMEALEKAMDAELQRIVTDKVTAAELERAKTRLVAETIYAQDSQISLARAYGSTLTTGGTIEEVRNWPVEVRRVTAEEVQAAAAMVLDLRRSVTGTLLPKDGPT
jgi:zinc protease